MLSSLLSGASLTDILIQVLLYIPAILLAISLHEYAHAWMAYKCGDMTATMLGRRTANPLAHLDPVGAISMLLIGFGWARPVPINPRNFRHYKRDTVLVSLAGPVMNFIIAFAAAALYYAVSIFAMGVSGAAAGILSIVRQILYIVFILDVNLMIFNLIPIPPLDGSKILFSVLPSKAYNWLLRYERYGFIVLIVLLYSGILNFPLGWITSKVVELINIPIVFVINLFM